MTEPVTSAASEEALNVYMTEFQTAWNEIFSRFDNQRQAFNYLIAIFGAVAALLTSDTFKPDPELFLWLPLVVAPLGFIFFDNELMIWGIVNYTSKHLHPQVARLVNSDQVLLLEARRFGRRRTQRCHRTLSYSRWSLFILPIILCMAYGAWKSTDWWRSPYVVLFGVDCAATGVLIWGMWRAARDQCLSWPWTGVDSTSAGAPKSL